MTTVLTAEKFMKRLTCLQSDEELKKHQRYFKFVPYDQDADDYFIGVRMGSIFETKTRICEGDLFWAQA